MWIYLYAMFHVFKFPHNSFSFFSISNIKKSLLTSLDAFKSIQYLNYFKRKTTVHFSNCWRFHTISHLETAKHGNSLLWISWKELDGTFILAKRKDFIYWRGVMENTLRAKEDRFSVLLEFQSKPTMCRLPSNRKQPSDGVWE